MGAPGLGSRSLRTGNSILPPSRKQRGRMGQIIGGMTKRGPPASREAPARFQARGVGSGLSPGQGYKPKFTEPVRLTTLVPPS